MSSGITINFVNQSNQDTPIDVVVYNVNNNDSFDSLSLAWVVFKDSNPGDSGSIFYPTNGIVQASFNDGGATQNTALWPVENGSAYAVKETSTGITIVLNGNAAAGDEVDVLNDLTAQEIGVTYYTGPNAPLAQQSNIPPQSKAVFELLPRLWFGVAQGIVQGEAINTAVLNVETKFDLTNVASCTITLTGGGTSGPYVFTQSNMVYDSSAASAEHAAAHAA
ncbi:MAG: hypothetical protein JOZ51_16335 [Chloroflexi bacterium]|nr:hypothetical protein [Chloroflexota bacterium]